MTEHYFTAQTSEFKPKLISIHAADDSFQIYSAAGIFSAQKLDAGTKILLRYANISSSAKVADLGCGYGVVAISLLRKYPKLKMYCFDTNPRAITLTKMNLKLHSVSAIVLKSEIFSATQEKFDHILTNPPYSAGRAVCVSFIKESAKHLVLGGTLQLVCRRRKGGDYLESVMKEVFGNVEVMGSGSGYRLYSSKFSDS